MDFGQHDLDTFRALFNEAMSSGQRHVRSYIESLEVVERRPIYGYHRRRHRQLRINLFDPGVVKQAALLLRSGALCNGHRFAVQHAHLPYPLQFFIEYRLFGMNWMHVSPSGYRFRAPLPSGDVGWTIESVPATIVSQTPRQSNCCLEADIVAGFIRNVKDPLPDGLTVPSLADVWRDLRLSSQAICPLSLDARKQYEYSEIETAYRRRLEALVAKSAELQASQRPSQSQPMMLSYDEDVARRVCTQPSGDLDDLVADLNENRFGTRDVVVAEDDESSDDEEAPEAEPPAESDDQMAGLHDVLIESDVDGTDDDPALSQICKGSQNSAATEPLTQSQRSFTASQCDDALNVFGTQRPRKVPAPTLAQEPYFSDPEHRVKELSYIRKDGRRINTDRLFLEKTSFEVDFDGFGGGGCLLRPFKDPPTLHDLISAKTASGVKLISEAGHIDSNGRVVMGRLGNHDAVTQSQVGPATADGDGDIAMNSSESVASSPSSSQSQSNPFGHHRQHLRVVALESLHQNRGDLDPDPKCDAVLAVAIGAEIDGQSSRPMRLLVNSAALNLPPRFHLGYDTAHVALVQFDDEMALLDGIVHELVHLDPDIVVAYEIQKQSLGYLSDRAATLGINNFLDRISRLIPKPDPPNQSASPDAWGERKASGLQVPGRIVLNLWRILRSELKLSSYSLHVVCLHLLGGRVPHHSWPSLNRMVNGGLNGVRRALDDRLGRVRLDFALLANQNLLQRTSELARLFGIDFFSVLTRGSQYRVESVMVRQGVAEDFTFYSASPEQVAHQPAMECIPLVMEPRSAMYSDPVIVLDFQSLYPSIVISRDICYSTCLGSIISVEKALDADSPSVALGAGGSTSSDLSFLSHRKAWVSPNGVVFVDRRPDDGRNGLLPRLLRDLLETRVAIKKAMKSLDCNDPRWSEMNAKQFGIKLLANVTYGYTAAGFSGRMPCAEIADSIVQTGRETLEKAIEIVENDPDWDAEVVYADTDSLFVSVPGRTLQEAFEIGQQISDRVTAVNPPPVKLMFEKVYQPCLLVSKKRYVGLKYEAPDQVPVIDAKGLEVIRRDGCPLLVSAMDNAIKLMFKKDLSRLRRYLERLWTRMMMGEISTMQYVFAKEVRLGTYRVLPPAAQIATERMKRDPRSYPLYAERIPYLVVYGNQNDRLMDLVVPPDRLLKPNSGLHINVNYYITKQILPSLNRITSLIHINIWHWWRELPRGKTRKSDPSNAWTIDRYCLAQKCTTCGDVTSRCLCSKTAEMPGLSDAVESHGLQIDLQLQNRLCKECSGCDRHSAVLCEELHCPSYHERARLNNRLAALDTG